MTNEEIRSKLMQQADMVAETEEIEVVLADSTEHLKDAKGVDDILKLFERSAMLRKMFLENCRQEAMSKASLRDPSPMTDQNRNYLSSIEGGSISPESRGTESFLVPLSGLSHDSTTEDQMKQTDKLISEVLAQSKDRMTPHLRQFVDLHSRLRKLDFKIHKNIVYIETALMFNARSAERVVAQERLALELSKNKLIDMADEDDRLFHALSESFKARPRHVLEKIRADNREVYELQKDKDIDIQECSLMLSTALSRLNSLKALKGFIKKKNRLLELKTLEEEREQIRKEKAEVDNQIIKSSLLGAQQRYSNQSSRRPSQRSLTSKQISPTFSSNLLHNGHKKKNSDFNKGTKEGFLTFGSSFRAKKDSSKDLGLNQLHSETDLKDTLRMESVDQLSNCNDSKEINRSSCPATCKQPTRILFGHPTNTLQQIKESQHIFEGNIYDSPLVDKHYPVHKERKPTVDSIKKSLVGSAKQTSRLFEMREELRRKQATSNEKEIIKPKVVLSGTKASMLGSGTKSRLGSREKDVRTSYFSLAFGNKVNIGGNTKFAFSSRLHTKEREIASSSEGFKEGQTDPDTARTVVKTKSSRQLSTNSKIKAKLKQEMAEVKKRIDIIRMSGNMQGPIHQISKDSNLRKEDPDKASHSKLASKLNSSKGSLKQKGTPVKVVTSDKLKSPSGSGFKYFNQEKSKNKELNSRRFVLGAKLEYESPEMVRISHRIAKNAFLNKPQPAVEDYELNYDDGWFTVKVADSYHKAKKPEEKKKPVQTKALTRENSYTKIGGLEAQKAKMKNRSNAGSVDKLWPEPTQRPGLRFNIDSILDLSVGATTASLKLDDNTKISFKLSTHEQLQFFTDLKSLVG